MIILKMSFENSSSFINVSLFCFDHYHYENML